MERLSAGSVEIAAVRTGDFVYYVPVNHYI
jgi:hypothetical protein